MGRGVIGSKFVPSIKNIVREICISSCEGFECSGNNIKLSECKRDISRNVQTYGLGINRVKKSATKWILFFAVQVNKCHISRANFSRIVNYN